MADLTTIPNDYHDARGERVYSLTILFPNEAMRKAMVLMVKRMSEPAAWTPFGHAGEPQDPPEEWPSDKTARDYPTGAGSGGVTPRLPNGRLDPEALQAAVSKVREALPPNCDGFGQPIIPGTLHVEFEGGGDFKTHGEALAHAQHKAAEGGEGCDSVACSITQGVSD